VRRGEAWKPLREHGKWMRLSERAVFLALLERSDNADCAIPAHMTPSLVQLAEACCCSVSAVKLALDHLDRHGWLIRKRTRGGRGHKTTYQLDHGWPCPLTCEKRATQKPVSGDKQATQKPEKQAKTYSYPRRSGPVSDEGIREGEVREGTWEELPRLGASPEPCRADPDQQWLDAHPFDAMGDWPPGSHGEDANRVRGETAAA
jgi:hypothetical protein